MPMPWRAPRASTGTRNSSIIKTDTTPVFTFAFMAIRSFARNAGRRFAAPFVPCRKLGWSLRIFMGRPPDQNIASAEQSEFEPGVLAKDIVLWCRALRNDSRDCPFRTMRWRGSPRDNIGPSDQGLKLPFGDFG